VPYPANPYAAYPGTATDLERRPSGVTVACLTAIVLSSITALLMLLGLFGVLASRDAVEDEMMKNSDFRELDISAGDVIAVVTVVLVVLIIWSLITVLLGVLTMRRSNVARILLVVSSAVVALLSLVGITSVFTAIWLLGGITVIVLLFIGDASRWFSRKPPSSSPGYLQY